jgi:hypothetical protein
MKNLIISLLILFVFCETSFGGNSGNNLSTNLALEKYGNLLKNHSFLVFPELRENPIKWFDSIPEGKVTGAIRAGVFEMQAKPGELFVFQLGLWAFDKEVKDLQIKYSDFKDEHGQIIAATRITCFNKGGIDFTGKPFSKEVTVPAGRVQALWLGVDLDKIKEGNFKGSVTVLAGTEKVVIPLLIKVNGDSVPNHGYNEGSRLSRLGWLNSTVGINDEITKGFLPVNVEQKKISILGRTLNIADSGLPESIISYFGASNQSLVDRGEPIVNHPFRFVVEKEDGTIIRLVPDKMTFKDKSPSRVAWSVMNRSDEFDLECIGAMEFDGFVDYQLKLTVKKPVKVKDIRLEIPVVKEKSEYMMGLGHEGGFRTPEWKWRWDVSNNQDMLWGEVFPSGGGRG